MSHIDKPLTVALTATRGKRKNFTVQVLKATAPAAAPATDWHQEIGDAGGDVDALRALYTRAANNGATPDVLDAIKAAATPTPADAVH